MPTVPASPDLLPSALAARLLHDVKGALSGVVSGLDLLADPALRDMHADALALARDSVRGLADRLTFLQTVYGSSAARIGAETLESLASGLFADSRARLVWSMTGAELPAAAGRVLLGLVDIAQSALLGGGEARVSVQTAGADIHIRLAATGTRVRFAPETLDGLAGRPFSHGLAGKWAPAYYLWTLTTACGGDVALRADDAGVTFEATLAGA